jgi:Mg2+-importing ATPase
VQIPAGLTGLGDDEVAARRAESCSNAIEAPRVTLVGTFLRQFASPFDALLLGAATLAFVLRDATDASIVLTIVLISAVLGARNEYRAGRILEDLRGRISRKATVVRGGELRRVDAADVVVGDVVALTLGDAVPADLTIHDATGLECDESVLTGESRPVEKAAGDEAYMGTTVGGGYGFGVVIATGKRTRFGAIAQSAARRSPETAFQIGLRKFSTLLLIITVIVTLVIIVAAVCTRNFGESRPADAYGYRLRVAFARSLPHGPDRRDRQARHKHRRHRQHRRPVHRQDGNAHRGTLALPGGNRPRREPERRRAANRALVYR